MLEYIFSHPPANTFIEVGSLTRRGYVDSSLYRELEAQLVETYNEDTYFGVALRKQKGMEKSDVYGTRALWVDIDTENPDRAVLPPSFIVFSGGGFHYYWLLDSWCSDIERIEDANKILSVNVRGDHCWNVNRILRVPGTKNTARGKMCVLREVNPHLVYTIDDIFRIQQLSTKTIHKIRTGDRRGFRSRSERDWTIITDLVAAGYSDNLICTLFQEQPCGDKVAEAGAKYLAHTIENVRAQSVERKAAELESAAREVRTKTKRPLPELFERDSMYFVTTARGEKQLSTFVIEPKLLLEGEDYDSLLVDIVKTDYTWENIIIPKEAFNSRRSLDKVLTIASWNWLGRDDDIRALLPYLMQKLVAKGLPRVKTTQVLGRHRDLWIATTQTVSKDVVWASTDAPLIYTKAFDEVPHLQYPEQEDVDADYTDPFNLLTNINRPQVAYPVLGWYMATFYKPILEEQGHRFPILNLFGTRGSGKTSLTKQMQRCVGYTRPVSWDCATTRFVTLKLLACTNAVPLSFSEYRGDVGAKFLRFVLLAYDVGMDARGRADQTFVDYPLRAPFSVDGEDLLADSAAKERIVPVLMHPEDIVEGGERHSVFKKCQKFDFGQFALGCAKHSLTFDIKVSYDIAYTLVCEAFPQLLPDRIRNNITVCVTGLLSLFDLCRREYPTKEDVADWFTDSLECVWSSSLGRSYALVDEFVEAVVNNVVSGKPGFRFTVDDNGNVLWMQLATAYPWWVRSRRLSGMPVLERDAIRVQLLERSVGEGAGQYILPPRAIGDLWCYGIKVDVARESGLDIPSNVDTRILKVSF